LSETCFFGDDTDAEVEDFDAIRAVHDVGRLQITMDDSRAVNIAQGFDETLSREPQKGRLKRSTVFDSVVEGFSRKKLHHQIGLVTLGYDINDFDRAVS
jgi:hypothetical protein